AGDLAGGVHPLLDVDREREEVGALARLLPPLRRGEHHRIAAADDDRAVRLLRELARLERDLLVPDLDGDLRETLGRDTHELSSTLLRGERELEPAPVRARSNFHPPVRAWRSS